MQRYHIGDVSDPGEFETLLLALGELQEYEFLISYPAEYGYTKQLRESVDMICKQAGIPPKWRTRIVLIYDELCNNAIEHGSRGGDTNILYIKIEIHTESFVICGYVEDEGHGIERKSASEMRELQMQNVDKNFLEHHSIRGRGLFLIIIKLVEDLSFEDTQAGGLRVIFKKTISLRSH